MVDGLALAGEAAGLVGHEALALSCTNCDCTPMNNYHSHETSGVMVKRTFAAEVGLSTFAELAFSAL